MSAMELGVTGQEGSAEPEDSRQGLITQNSFDVKSGELGPRQETILFPPQREEEPVWKGGHVLAQSRKAIRTNGQSLYSPPAPQGWKLVCGSSGTYVNHMFTFCWVTGDRKGGALGSGPWRRHFHSIGGTRAGELDPTQEPK